MTTLISELRLQLFKEAPEFGKQFDTTSYRYKYIRENYFFYYYMIGEDTNGQVMVADKVLFETFQKTKDNIRWEPYLKYYDELKNILHHQDFQQVERIIDRYRQDIEPNTNRANIQLF